MEIATSQSLSDAWKDAVSAGQIVNEFEAPSDDAVNRWSSGDHIAFGITITPAGLGYYACHLTTARPIQATVNEQSVGNNGFICQLTGIGLSGQGGVLSAWGVNPIFHLWAAAHREC